ncbi:MAG: ATP-binding protein [Oligoflexia bacterium]|nr:ATP-binding protein [Oligoflexia bacterium]
MIHRYLHKQIEEDLLEKMVFIGGPRQVGKTTLSQSIFSSDQQMYLNWDNDQHRKKLLKYEFEHKPLWIFDEIHKYKKWRNYIKGLYDTYKKERKIIITGSARLDYYRFSGDSLQGRYHYLRLFPLSFKEIRGQNQNDIMNLFLLSGFPEPFYQNSQKKANRWTAEYSTRFIREDLTSIERIEDLGTLELLIERLPECVGSPLSINSLREDLQINFRTVSRWLDIIERLYSIFRILPLNASKLRAVKKERKHYHYDWNLVSNLGARFENFIAVHLLKYVSFYQDTEGAKLDLRFYKDLEKREVDFVILDKSKPSILVECKLNDEQISSNLIYLKNKFPETTAYQISLHGKKDYLSKDGIRICPATHFLKELL